MIKYIILLALVLAVLGAAFWVGRRSVSPEAQDAVSSRVILEAIQDQAFLVTKTLFLDEEVTITLADPKGWKGFFVGDELNARALVRADVGVDLEKLTEDDIQVDTDAQLIKIRLPDAAILDSSLSGTVEVQSSRGVWTSIRDFFTREDGDDYNRAVQALIAQAEESVVARADIIDSARADTAKLIMWLAGQIVPASYRVEIVR